jgi:hypothetical protein
VQSPSNIVSFPARDPSRRLVAARDKLLQLQIGISLALATLDQSSVFGEGVALDGVDDILAALVALVV